MKRKTLLWLVLGSLLGAWDWNPLRCAEIYQKQPTVTRWENVEFAKRRPAALRFPGALKKQEFRIEYNESNTYQILRGVNRLVVEGERHWLIRDKEFSEIAVPEGQMRWSWFFKMTWQEVIKELELAELYRVDYFANGLEQTIYEGKLLKGYEIRQNADGETVYVFRIDPRILKLMDLVEEPAIANLHLESGAYSVVRFDRIFNSY